MSEVKCGDAVVLEPVNNMKSLVNDPVRGVVTKIGRKYFYVKPNGFGYTYRFECGTNKCVGERELAPQWILHISEQAYKDVMESRDIIDKLHAVFEWRNSPSVRKIPIEKLRQMLNIVKETVCQK